MRWLAERFIIGLSLISTALLFLCVVVVTTSVFWRGLDAYNLQLIFGTVNPLDALLGRKPVFNGLLPALAGTALLVCCALAVATPVGLATGIYLAEYAPSRWRVVLSALFDILAGLPSIVIGLSGFAVTIYLHRLFPGRIGPCLLISALSLGFLVLPYIIRSTQLALESVEPAARLTAPALGATRWQTIRHVLLPASTSRILGGIILAIGRAAEDTAVIMLTGVVASAGLPRSLLEQFEALPFFIYYISSQYSTSDELEMGFAASFLLLLLCGFLFLLAFVFEKFLTRNFSTR
ncbi:PstA family ABC transporter permease [Desulfofustis limnaeus]|jgi:phosphate transport system permease protein|uniref:Phosphate ABC transporter permease n=1 Tax=Desulfofustis limnaeus TaxID=2740163 RepID=A0ABM7WBP7_9BACT|nr:ABC transporter permease subunit [Desulfofustis limnaeus]MDX9895854.1 ABC transporter permease subunit [Desulfofustis sp.]BDD88423.1 phosphate ABC transporter permease [Desulfofustis limnaeus]